MSVSLKVKAQGAWAVGKEEFNITVEHSKLVRDLKTEVALALQIEPEGLKMVAQGKILTPDEATIGKFDLKDGSTLYCVQNVQKPAPAAAASVQQAQPQQQSTQPAGAGGNAGAAVQSQAPAPVASSSANPLAFFQQLPLAPVPIDQIPDNLWEKLKAKYGKQFEELKDMGFEQHDRIILKALNQSGGDIERTIVRLEKEAEAVDSDTQTSNYTYEEGEVVAHVYDISDGKAHTSSQTMIGTYMEVLPHTGIVCFGKEHYFSLDPAVCMPGQSLASPVKKTIKLGKTTKSAEELNTFLESIKSEYTLASYNFLTCNSNHYADAVAKFLLDGKGLPDELLKLAENVQSTPQGQQLAKMLEGQPGSTTSTPAPAPAAFANQQLEARRSRFQAQLTELNEMGFSNETLCLQGLEQANGNIEQAISFILAASGEN